jgi:3'-phosphoadenosine 5'-phosphosulfate sulfotransferase (PAPS reductase)/FAD synthetase
MIHVVSVSGGKDSTALWLWAIRTGLSPLLPLFCDTQWESEKDGISTYAYLDDLERRLGPIRRVTSEGFEARTRRGGTFPSRVRKWCSPELKVAMCAAELVRIREETGDDVEVLVGFRKDESPKRAEATAREWMPEYDCDVVRPLLDWSVQDVIEEHRRAGVPMNPLYHLGAERVGCWPCIHAGKTEIALVARHDPERIARIAAIEADIGQTMFVLRETRKGKAEDDPDVCIPTPIQEMAKWALTSRGGKVIPLWPAPTGCQRWGTCEFPVTR